MHFFVSTSIRKQLPGNDDAAKMQTHLVTLYNGTVTKTVLPFYLRCYIFWVYWLFQTTSSSLPQLISNPYPIFYISLSHLLYLGYYIDIWYHIYRTCSGEHTYETRQRTADAIVESGSFAPLTRPWTPHPGEWLLSESAGIWTWNLAHVHVLPG